MNAKKPDDICCRPDRPINYQTIPHSPPLVPTAVWRCASTQQADQMAKGELDGYIYQRDRHPNADMLAEKCAELHYAERAILTSSGMAALSLVVLSQLEPGDHVVLSNQLYGRSRQLLTVEAPRWGIQSTLVDACDLAAVRAALRPRTRLLVVETISNPLLRVSDIAALAEIADRAGAALLVDNTFASPVLCQPLTLGARWVTESVSKIMNGQSDVMLGLLCGQERAWERVPTTMSVWGLASGPFDCWLAIRGLATLHLRAERASDNAYRVAEFLASQDQIERVDYPGLTSHPDHELASRILPGRFGAMVTFHLKGGRGAADAFIAGVPEIPFCPSLGDVNTTLSHPESTSHRGLTSEQRHELGISGGTVRLSVGIESPELILNAIKRGLQ